MTSKLDIINAALMLVGAKKLMSLTTDTKSQRVANAMYDTVRNELFDKQVEWRFATARAQLVKLATNPSFGYDFQYPLPANCRRILAMVDDFGDEIEFEYRREVFVATDSTQTDVILTNESTVRVKFIVLRPEPSVYPAWFSNAIYVRLARLIFQPIKEDTTLFRKIERMWIEAWNDALAGNASEEVITNGTGKELDDGNTDVTNAATGSLVDFHRRTNREFP